jgi:transcriptional regulator with GAF, ATPase, and Fis domain
MTACLKAISGAFPSGEHSLNRTGENLIGRGTHCCVQIADASVALLHAKISFNGLVWHLIDCGSPQGTLVNGTTIESWELVPGDKIRIGSREFLFLDSQHPTGLNQVDTQADFSDLIGQSESMRQLKKIIARIAKASGCILVRGESGTGKELVARAIHRNSLRSSKPMLSVNCAAIPEDLMDSQLFGHIKGAFTGADHDHIGYFQQADQGTLFLDEVGELNLEGQAKLLRILEGHPYLAVGGTKEIRVDVHVVSATNRDLREFVAERRFREDLYYRLNVFEIEIPPLRERGLDIELLARFFLEKFKQLNNRDYVEFSEEAVLALLNYDWPGNVRQLRNVIENAVVLAEDWKIRPEDLKLRTGQRSNKRQSIIRIDPSPTDNGDPDLSINTFAPIPFIGDPTERSIEPEHFDTLEVSVWQERLIKEALRRTKGDIPAAADLLGMARSTLYRRLEKGLSDAV